MCCTTLFWMVCFIGLLVHVYFISEKYFAFEATTNLRLDVPQKLPVPALSTCWRYGDLLDVETLRKDIPTIQRVDLNALESERLSSRLIQSLVTIGQVFNHTPSVDEMFANCIVRRPGFYDVDFLNVTMCQEVFDVDKFYVQENICYRIQFRDNNTYDYSFTSSALAYPSMVFEFGFNRSLFDPGPIIIPTVHDQNFYPTSSIYFAPQLRRYFVYNRRYSDRLSYFTLSYIFIDNTRLPPPYATNCDYYEQFDGQVDYCMSRCLTKATIAAWDLFPFTEIVKQSELSANNSNKKIINNLNWNNETFTTTLRDIENKCSAQCSKPNCYERLYLTQLQTSSIYETSISLRVNLPMNPNYHITYQPMMLLYEYLTYVLSCLGIWFGLSLFHLNPGKCGQDNQERKNDKYDNFHYNQKFNDFDRKWAVTSSTNRAELVKVQVELNMLKGRVQIIERELGVLRMLDDADR